MARRATQVLRRHPVLWRGALALRQKGEHALRRWRGPAILRRRFLDVCGYPLDEEHPVTFTEHLYCRMLRMHREPDPMIQALADKLSAREYVSSRVGHSYLPRLLWHGSDPAKIPFDQFPDRFVVKTNHGCGQIVRVGGRVDQASVVSQLRDWMSQDYYWVSREPQYLDINPQVLVEERLADLYADGPLDYRFFCFHGRPAMLQVSDHSHLVHHFFDLDWRRLDIRNRPHRGVYDVARPTRLEEMVDVAGRLSHGFDFVRVDLYELPGRVVAGELTFTPNAGYRPFQPSSVEKELGRLWAGISDEADLPLA